MCKCVFYEKGDSENERQNKHFAMYFAIIDLNQELLSQGKCCLTPQGIKGSMHNLLNKGLFR
jgi:hypothetical protein